MKHAPYARHKKPLNSEMNVVPYIDVMLVLLIIFMATAPMLTTGVEIDLPKEKTATLSKENQLPVIVSLKADGSLFLSHDTVIDEPITKDALLAKLGELASQNKDPQGQSSLQVMLNADATNQYSTIMHLMAGMQGVGISKIGLLSSPPNK